jgi:Electron transfer DM13
MQNQLPQPNHRFTLIISDRLHRNIVGGVFILLLQVLLVTIIYSRNVNQLTVVNKEYFIMKFIQVSILCLASLVLISSAKAATQDRVPVGSAAIDSIMEIRPQTTQMSNSDRPLQLAATTLKSGQFIRGEQATRGGASIVTKNGRSFLQLDSAFKTSSQGPDLVVVLHRSRNILGTTQAPNYALKGGDYVVLARLKKYSGAQRYAIPANINLANYRSAAIWCRKFNATFGVAPLG